MKTVAFNHKNDTWFGNGLVMGYADCKCQAGLVETLKVVSIVSLALCQTHCMQVPDFSPKVASLQFLPSGQYVLCFGYSFLGPLPLLSHKEQVTFSGPFLGVLSLLRLHSKSARTILALKLSGMPHAIWTMTGLDLGQFYPSNLDKAFKQDHLYSSNRTPLPVNTDIIICALFTEFVPSWDFHVTCMNLS